MGLAVLMVQSIDRLGAFDRWQLLSMVIAQGYKFCKPYSFRD